MKFTRKLSVANTPVEYQVKWKTVPIELKDKTGAVIFSMPEVEIPANWSDTAAQILATKYFRKAGVPQSIGKVSEEGIPGWLWRSRASTVDTPTLSETSARQVLHRLAGHWTYVGWKNGYFKTLFGSSDESKHSSGYVNDEKSARIFYDELFLILARQLAAPNSPQWFNTGLWWAYGIEGPPNGQWAIDYEKLARGAKIDECVYETSNSYKFPQPHACFIQPVEDDLVNAGGIMDLWTREARLFKYGSGTGSNFSNLRGENEPLSGGGRSSGLMSFLEIGDRAAGAIKSGGTTRRAAKMVIVDADHPDVEKFIDWKAREEQKAAAMWIGSTMLNNPKLREILSENGLLPMSIEDQLSEGMSFGVFGIDYEGEAIRTVSGQNANNTVRVRDEFMLDVEQHNRHSLRERTTGKEVKVIGARDLWTRILRAAWASADPGLQFHSTINKWHTCKADGDIHASNPCSEYMFLDNTACNLASLNLAKFYTLTNLADPASYRFDVELFIHVTELMTVVLDISVTMASFPSKEIALGSYNYRTLGLGYANLGGLLMRMGLAYNSDIGRAQAEAITALLTGVSYYTSAILSEELGAFPRWEANKESMAEVIELHTKASKDLRDGDIAYAARRAWNEVYQRRYSGFRNAQVTLLAPTGTIGLLMDCDTLGIEPDYSLLKHKSLAGGGGMSLVNEAVDQALTKLGYKTHSRNLIRAYIRENGTAEGCKDLQPEHVAVFDCANHPPGFQRAIAPMGHVLMCAAVQPFLSGAISKTINMPNSASVEDVGEVYMQAWKLGLKAVSIYRDGSKLAQPLQAAGGDKQEKPKPVSFKGYPTDFPLPRSEFIEKVTELYEETKEPETRWERRPGKTFTTASGNKINIPPQAMEVPAEQLMRGVREYLPWRRQDAYTQKVNISGQSVHLTVGCYPDGRPGEIRLDLSRVGTTLNAFGDMAAMMISIGLQYGVPVEEFVKRLSDRKFDPSGFVEGHENIKYVSSIADFIARELGITFLKRPEMGQVQPAEPEQTEEVIDRIIGSHPNAFAVASDGDVGVVASPMTKLVLDLCPSCHEPTLTTSGSCKTCTNCGYNDGCGG